MRNDLPHLEPLFTLRQWGRLINIQDVGAETQLEIRGTDRPSRLRLYQTICNAVSLDAVGGCEDDGGGAGEERGAAAVPALVAAQHGHVPGDLPHPGLATWPLEIVSQNLRCSSPPTT